MTLRITLQTKNKVGKIPTNHDLGISCKNIQQPFSCVNSQTTMASQKQSLPSFPSILSVLSIVLYCACFLRVELELNEQKKRINALENTEEATLSDVRKHHKLTRNAAGKFL